MSLLNSVQKLVSAILLLAGADLLLYSPEIEAAIRPAVSHSGFTACIVLILLWLTSTVAFILYARHAGMSESKILRWVFAFAIFVTFLMPHNEWDYVAIATQIIAIIAAALLLAGLLLCRLLHPALSMLDRLVSANRWLPSWLFVGLWYVVFLCAALALSWHCFSFFPIYTDTEGQYIHAKYIAMGHLTWPANPYPSFFYLPMSVTDNGRWYSQYQPLHILMIALGHLAGTPWMVNPVEGALTLVATYVLARRITDEKTARLSALLVLASQMILFMSSGYMNHASALLFTTLFLWAYAETLHTEGRIGTACSWGFAAGLCIGAVFLVRPLTAVGVALPFIFYSLWLMMRNRHYWLEPMLAMAAGGLACLAFDAWYNFEVTGNALVMPYTKYSGSIASQVWFGKGHSLVYGLRKTHGAWLLMNKSLFEWALPCTLFVLIAWLRPLKHPMLRLMLAMLVCYSAANVFNKWWSSVFGPRYIYETSTALIIFTAIGMRRLPEMLQRWSLNASARRGAVTAVILLIFAISASTRLPANIRMYSHYFDDNPEFYYSLLRQSQKPALVFIGQTANKDDRNAHYRWVTHANPPTKDSPVVFACDLGLKEDSKLMAFYPNRHPYLERNGILYPINPRTLTSGAPPGPRGTPR